MDRITIAIQGNYMYHLIEIFLFIVFSIDYIILSQRLVNAYQGSNVDEAMVVLSTLCRQHYN